MSRYIIKSINMNPDISIKIYKNCSLNTFMKIPDYGQYKLAYGFDYACGYFLSFFPANKASQNAIDNISGYPDTECLDLDSMFSGFTGAELAFILSLFDGDKEHIDLAYMDYPF